MLNILNNKNIIFLLFFVLIYSTAAAVVVVVILALTISEAKHIAICSTSAAFCFIAGDMSRSRELARTDDVTWVVAPVNDPARDICPVRTGVVGQPKKEKNYQIELENFGLLLTYIATTTALSE